MPSDNNYNEILEKVCKKLNQLDSVKDIDLLEIKNSVESIENILTDTQSKLNFQEIKEKLENIALQVDTCNESLLKDLYNDINKLKETSEGIGAHLENIQNVQNLSLTSAEFEEFQKQQLDLALKTNENIFRELTNIKENSSSANNLGSLQNLENQLTNLHKNLTGYIEQIAGKIESSPNIDEIASLMADMSSINQKNIKQTNTLIKEIEANFSDFKNKEFAVQIAKISEIYDSLNIIHAWIEKVGFLNKSIENVYARLGANIDFDDVSEKIDIVYENIAALNNWTMKIDNIDGNMADMQSKVASLGSCIEDTKNIADVINSIKNRLDSSFNDDIDLEDLSNKMDIVYENLTALNDWSKKIDDISLDVSVINDKISEKADDSKIQKISENIRVLNTNINQAKNENDENSAKLEGKLDDISSNLNEKIDEISEKVSTINETFENELIASKVDLIYENIGLLNDWVSKIDGIAQKSEELDNKFNRTSNDFNLKVDEITKTLSNASKIIEDVPNIKDNLEDLSKELHLITRTTKNETESYIYTLLDIESDFLKLHKFLDDKTEQTTQDINSLKERFEELNDDISSISKRTNKLILTADDANKEFRNQLEVFKTTIMEFEQQKQDFNPELKFNTIGNKLTTIYKLLQNSLNTSRNLNTAFIYLAEWIDTTDNVLKTLQNDISDVKEQTSKDNVSPEIIENISVLKSEIEKNSTKISELENAFTNYKNEDVSELKSLITGVIVQLNTALTPDIDALNNRIDKLTEENSNKLTELEQLMQEKINQQAKQIESLEEKVDSLNSKIDKLIDSIDSNNSNSEIKDILNYIATQMAATNEVIASNQNSNTVINTVAEKLESFDNNINKLVSYIEED